MSTCMCARRMERKSRFVLYCFLGGVRWCRLKMKLVIGEKWLISWIIMYSVNLSKESCLENLLIKCLY